MKTYPEFHDGFLEGLRIDKERKDVRLYLATLGGQRATVYLTGVVMLKAGGFKEGNIILDVSVRDSAEITAADITELYELGSNRERSGWEQQLLRQVKEQGLRFFEVNPSYGGSCFVLAQTIELIPGNDTNV